MWTSGGCCAACKVALLQRWEGSAGHYDVCTVAIHYLRGLGSENDDDEGRPLLGGEL